MGEEFNFITNYGREVLTKKTDTNKNKELSAVAWSAFQRLTCKSVV